MPLSSASKRAAGRGFAPCAAVAASGSGLALAASGSGPAIKPDRHCYTVGATVHLRGSGFPASCSYVVSIDDVHFGRQLTDGGGAFLTSPRPGGLDAGVAQAVERLEASDGTSTAATTFTVTRSAGARFVASGSSRTTQRLPLEVWGFATDGRSRSVDLHYLAPSGRAIPDQRGGRTGGQCGHLRTRPRPICPFTPAGGDWTLQLDTHRSYKRWPSGPIARVRVRIG